MALRTRNVLSLCAGVGGLDLGIQLALAHLGCAGRGVAYVEGEVAAASSLVASMEAGWLHPAPIWSDVRTFDARPWRGLVHIVASGDPCQDNSVAGRGLGEEGERFLAPEVCRIADECRPDVIFRENVPGNASGQLAAVVPPLERLGYRVAAGIFSSAETRNSMRRERLFIMAERDGAGLYEHAQFNGEPEQSERQASRRGDAERCGLSMGSPTGARSLSRSQRRIHLGEEGRGPRDAQSQRRSGAMGVAGRCVDGGLEEVPGRLAIGRIAADRTGRASVERLPPAVIPGPTDSRWIDVLDRFPELQPALSAEEVESHLRRGVDAMAHRIERLRATGNGVDPLVGAYAFLSLSALLDEQRARSREPVLMGMADAWMAPKGIAA